MGLTALMLLQHARAPARFDAAGEIVLLEDQDRGRWDAKLIAEGLALIDKAMRHRRAGAVSDPGGHRRAACPRRARGGYRLGAGSTLLYAALERLQPSPVVTLNRAVAVGKLRGPAAALEMIEPLAPRLSGYFHFFGAGGAFLLQLGRTGGGARGVRPGDRAGQHAGRGGAYPPSSRPADAQEHKLTFLSCHVGPRSSAASVGR